MRRRPFLREICREARCSLTAQVLKPFFRVAMQEIWWEPWKFDNLTRGTSPFLLCESHYIRRGRLSLGCVALFFYNVANKGTMQGHGYWHNVPIPPSIKPPRSIGLEWCCIDFPPAFQSRHAPSRPLYHPTTCIASRTLLLLYCSRLCTQRSRLH